MLIAGKRERAHKSETLQRERESARATERENVSGVESESLFQNWIMNERSLEVLVV